MTSFDVDCISDVVSNPSGTQANAVSKLLTDLDFIAFDVETTGLSPIACKLVELSAVRFRLGSKETSVFSTLIHPETSIPEEVTAIHGITDEMVKDAPPAKDAIPAFLQFIGDENAVLIAHNAAFDVGFLRVAVGRLGITPPNNPVVDTLQLARCLISDVPNYQLKTLAEFYGVVSVEYHRALSDSFHVREIFEQMTRGSKQQLSSLSDLDDFNCLMRLAADETEWEVPAEFAGHASQIRKAIADGLEVRMVYRGAGTTHRPRVVKPLALLESRGNFYLSAFCPRVEAERTFRIDRIQSLHVLT
ncbi:MAG TPA: exonuclease domain-containing protein [Candidatus Obscuribacterales bacterium]